MPEDTQELDHRLELETRTAGASGQTQGGAVVPGLTIVYHADVGRIGERVALLRLLAGREELLSRREPEFSPPHGSIGAGGAAGGRPLADLYLSRRPIRLLPGSAPGGVRLVCGDSGTRVVVDGVPVESEREISAAEVERGAVLLLGGRVVLLLSRIETGAPDAGSSLGMVGDSPAMTRLRQEIRRVADLDVPVLLRGETGSGKELVARALHEAGPRSRRPFLAVNMGAIPPALASAELFGATRGSYTGADQRRVGYFSRADGGTLFLDEIGETPSDVQPLLLRVLESHEIQPVGGDVTRVDVRLIAATDADLETAVAEGRFRGPLLHRLGGYEIHVAPLRARREDFGRLMLHFLRQELAEIGEEHRLAPGSPDARPWLPAELVARMAAWEWPGNVRQLRNAVRRIVIAGRGAAEVPLGPQIDRLFREEGTPSGLSTVQDGAEPSRRGRDPRRYRRPDEVTDEELLETLRENGWRLQPTAARLGISRTSLYERIEKSPLLRKAADVSREEIEASREAQGGNLDRMAASLEVSKRGLQLRMKQLGMS
jgi:two-component system nitrogen regulation response regulator GlnG